MHWSCMCIIHLAICCCCFSSQDLAAHSSWVTTHTHSAANGTCDCVRFDTPNAYSEAELLAMGNTLFTFSPDNADKTGR